MAQIAPESSEKMAQIAPESSEKMAQIAPESSTATCTSVQQKLKQLRETVDTLQGEVAAIPGANCEGVQGSLRELRESVDYLSGAVSALSPHRSETWTSVPITDVGSSTLESTGTFAFDIPSVIPSAARNVLVYAYIQTGFANSGPAQHLKIFTQGPGDRRYEKYLYIFSYPQNAINTNSDNMWFPMPANRMIFMTVASAHGNNCHAKLHVIGYN